MRTIPENEKNITLFKNVMSTGAYDLNWIIEFCYALGFKNIIIDEFSCDTLPIPHKGEILLSSHLSRALNKWSRGGSRKKKTKKTKKKKRKILS